MNFDNKIPFQEAIALAKKVAAGDVSLSTVKEACWILGCTIEYLDGEVSPVIGTASVLDEGDLEALALQVSQMQQGFGDASAITPAQIALIMQFAKLLISLWAKK
jgi:hypothetical protein